MAVVLVLPASSAFAYTDDVQAGIEDVWQAARKVLEPVGIKKMDEKKRKMESRWVEDEVVRRNELFKGVMSQVYLRHYRIKISLTESGDNVQIEVKGNFEEKPKQSAAAAPWRKLKMQMQDYDIERAYFMRVLAQLAKDRS